MFLKNPSTFAWFAPCLGSTLIRFERLASCCCKTFVPSGWLATCFSITPSLSERFACYCHSKIPVPFEIVRFKRLARCFSNTLTLFERSAPRLKVVQSLSSVYSFYLQYSSPCKAVFPCFANTLTLFERYASTSVLFGRSAPCLSNIPCFFGAVCNLIREYSSPF